MLQHEFTVPTSLDLSPTLFLALHLLGSQGARKSLLGSCAGSRKSHDLRAAHELLRTHSSKPGTDSGAMKGEVAATRRPGGRTLSRACREQRRRDAQTRQPFRLPPILFISRVIWFWLSELEPNGIDKGFSMFGLYHQETLAIAHNYHRKIVLVDAD